MGEEAFGPVVVVQPVADVDAALALANASEFGLQGACFTVEPRDRLQGLAQARVGSLWINEASRFRLDTYPFGGVGSSRLRPRGRALRHGGNVAVEIHRHAAEFVGECSSSPQEHCCF